MWGIMSPELMITAKDPNPRRWEKKTIIGKAYQFVAQ